MTTFHLTISAVTDAPDVVADLLSEGGLFEDMPIRLAAHEGLTSSGCNVHVVDDDDPQEPSTSDKISALIDYLGENKALTALTVEAGTV